jgi:hypothetical protein
MQWFNNLASLKVATSNAIKNIVVIGSHRSQNDWTTKFIKSSLSPEVENFEDLFDVVKSNKR